MIRRFAAASKPVLRSSRVRDGRLKRPKYALRVRFGESPLASARKGTRLVSYWGVRRRSELGPPSEPTKPEGRACAVRRGAPASALDRAFPRLVGHASSRSEAELVEAEPSRP